MTQAAVQEVQKFSKLKFTGPKLCSKATSSPQGVDKVHHSPQNSSFIFQSSKPTFNISQHVTEESASTLYALCGVS